MSIDSIPERRLETAHVLFVDLVGYSLVPMEEQIHLIRRMQSILRTTEPFRAAETAGELLCLPRGDGMACVFFRNPMAPIDCALEAADVLKSHPDIRLRMGIHSGPVYRVEDINDSADVTGAGIIMAQRVMDCGDAGHILLSSSAAETLLQMGDEDSLLHDLGVFEVKHGARLHLYNLYGNDLGNPSLPRKLRSRYTPFTPAERREAPGTPRPNGAKTAIDDRDAPGLSDSDPAIPLEVRAPLVTLLYRRNSHPDDELLRLIENRLTAAGYRVFVDRHLKVGEQWAREIERRIRESDAVVPLISEAALLSEMLEMEMQIAHESMLRTGRPRLLPVRVAYTGPLTESLAVLLDPIEYALWNGPEDDGPVADALLDALRQPGEPAGALPPGRLETVGGAVPLDSPFYVERQADGDLQMSISRRESLVLLKGARQMGKTSMLARGLQFARRHGSVVLLTDFQKLNAQHLESADSLLLTLAEWITDQLSLDIDPEQAWNRRRGPSVNFERFLRREVLEPSSRHFVWALDEVDRIFSFPYGSEVFGLFRSWHNDRSLDPDGPWSRMTQTLAYATEAHLFITDINQSPFNVGVRLPLEDFTPMQVADLNARYGDPLRGDEEIERFQRLVNGQPYLVRRGLNEMVGHGLPLHRFEEMADRDEGIYGDHLRRLLVLIVQDPVLSETVRGMLHGQPCPDARTFYRLRSAGILNGSSARECWFRCALYETYLERHLR